MKKLRAYGVRGKSGDWFESYLTNRKQFCSLNGLHSKAKKVTCGIPQGSCLGPLLFIIYLNDLEECLQFSRASIYADDTSLTIASSNSVKLVDDAHRELLNISEWMRVNKLSPNPKKTEFMVIGHPLKTRSLDLPEVLTLDGSDIKKVGQAKSLGIIIDESLTWDEQYRRVKGKMSAGLSAPKRLKNILPQSQLCSVYYALVESHLRYGDVIWGSLCKTKLAALQRLQSRAWSIIENAKIKDLWSSSWLNVENIIRYDRNVMTYKIVNRLCPENLFDKYLPRSCFSSYNTRNSQDLQIPRCRTEFFKKSFHYASLKVWNDTPSTIRELPTLNRFKQRLKTHLKG